MKKTLSMLLALCMTFSLFGFAVLSEGSVEVSFVSNDESLGTVNVDKVSVLADGILTEVPGITEKENAAFLYWQDALGFIYSNSTLSKLKFTQNTTITACFEKSKSLNFTIINDNYANISSFVDSGWSTVKNSASAQIGVSDGSVNVSLPVATSGQTVIRRNIDGGIQGNYVLEMKIKKTGTQGFFILDSTERALLMRWNGNQFSVDGKNAEMLDGVEYKLKLDIDGNKGLCDVYWNKALLAENVTYSGIGVTAAFVDMSCNTKTNSVSISDLVVKREIGLYKAIINEDYSKVSNLDNSGWIKSYSKGVTDFSYANEGIVGTVTAADSQLVVARKNIDSSTSVGNYYVEVEFEKNGNGFVILDCGSRAILTRYDSNNLSCNGMSLTLADNSNAKLVLFIDGYNKICDIYLNDKLLISGASYNGTAVTDMYFDISSVGSGFKIEKLMVYRAVENVASVTDSQSITVGLGGNFEMLSNLPANVEVKLDNGVTKNVEVKWSEGNFNGEVAGTYKLEGELVQSKYILNPNNLKATLNVIVDASKPFTFSYSNPYSYPSYMYNGNGLRDPYILKKGDIYYLTGTQPDHGLNTGGTTIWKSKNLKDWEFVCNPILQPDASEGKWYTYRFWAPEIFEHNGKYYYAVACTNANETLTGMAILVADDIEGPYTMLTKTTCLVSGIDATFFKDDDGKVYMYWAQGGISMQEIDLSTGRLIGKREIAVNTVSGDNFASAENSGIEGPYVVKREGVYYLYYSTWARGYEVGYATANHPLGPWTMNMEPVFGSMSKSICEERGLTYDPDYYANNFRDTGHISVFPGPDGNDWLAGHTIVATGSSVTMSIDPVEYKNGTIAVIDGENRVHGPTMGEKSVEVSNEEVTVIKAYDTHYYLKVGETCTLPDKVNIMLSNGWKDIGTVIWEGEAETFSPGEKIVNGTATYDGNTYSCKAYIHVSADGSDYKESFKGCANNEITFEPVRGDVDFDKKVSVYDAIAVLKHIAGIKNLSANGVAAGNVEGGNILTVTDATKILRYIARLILEL